MSLDPSCPSCGAPLPDDAREGALCEVCERAMGAESTRTAPDDLQVPAPMAPRSSMISRMVESIGDFEMVGKLGQGGMGTVYRVRQVSLNRLVALKILPAQFEDDEDYVVRFQREATLAASLNHPNLVRVYSSGYSDGCHYIAMELVEGENLRQRLKRGDLPITEALRICADVARALGCGWQQAQLIHRDIKPSNIYLSETGAVKLGDLGLAKSLLGNTTGLTLTGAAMGTPQYISPEQARGEKTLDFRADIYSLGCTLYELLTGSPPYTGHDAFSVINMHLTSPAPAIRKVMPQCPAPLAKLVGKMLKKNRAERHANYDDLIAELEQVRSQIQNGGKAGWPALAAAPRDPGDASLPPTPAPPSTPALWISLVTGVIVVIAGLFYLNRPKTGQRNAAVPAPFEILTSPDYEWSPPENLGPNVNSAEDDIHVTLSSDQLMLIFSKDANPPMLMECHRASIDEPFGKAVPMKVAGRAGTSLSGDGLTLMYFYDKGPEGRGSFDIYEVRRESRVAPWGPPRNAGPAVNTAASETGPFLEPDGLILFFSSARSGGIGLEDIWRSRRKSLDAPFEAAENLGPAINIAGHHEYMSKMTPDGRVLIFAREGGGEQTGLFISVRDAHGVFAPAQPLRLPVAGPVFFHWLSPDARTLYFGSNRPGGYGRCDIWLTRRLAKTQAAGPDTVTFKAATKEVPFVNTLGMKFVPVPATGGQRVLFSVWDTRVRDYVVFARAKKVRDAWSKQEKDGVPVSREPEEPVVSVNWEDATAFCQWLTEKERAEGKLPPGAMYRLPTDEEWSRAAGMAKEDGATPRERNEKNQDFPWGKNLLPPKAKVGNYADAAWHERFPKEKWLEGYTDSYPTTSPVGSFAPNAYGLYDMNGNVWQWCADLFEPGGTDYLLRGGSWHNYFRTDLLLSKRYHLPSTSGIDLSDCGFRVVLSAMPAGKPKAH